jgi:hypothetical protein
MDARAAAAAEQPVARVSASPSEMPTATSATPSELPSELPEVGTDGAVCAGPPRSLHIERPAPARRDLYKSLGGGSWAAGPRRRADRRGAPRSGALPIERGYGEY